MDVCVHRTVLSVQSELFSDCIGRMKNIYNFQFVFDSESLCFAGIELGLESSNYSRLS